MFKHEGTFSQDKKIKQIKTNPNNKKSTDFGKQDENDP